MWRCTAHASSGLAIRSSVRVTPCAGSGLPGGCAGAIGAVTPSSNVPATDDGRWLTWIRYVVPLTAMKLVAASPWSSEALQPTPTSCERTFLKTSTMTSRSPWAASDTTTRPSADGVAEYHTVGPTEPQPWEESPVPPVAPTVVPATAAGSGSSDVALERSSLAGAAARAATGTTSSISRHAVAIRTRIVRLSAEPSTMSIRAAPCDC